jgi:hypothetical protein
MIQLEAPRAVNAAIARWRERPARNFATDTNPNSREEAIQ